MKDSFENNHTELFWKKDSQPKVPQYYLLMPQIKWKEVKHVFLAIAILHFSSFLFNS